MQAKIPSWAEPLSKVIDTFLTLGSGSVRVNYAKGGSEKLELTFVLTKDDAQSIARALNLH